MAKCSNTELFKKIGQKLIDDLFEVDLVLYSEFFEKYRDSTASDVVGTVNDAYLQSQGTPGTKSYGMVVDLAVAYHKNAK